MHPPYFYFYFYCSIILINIFASSTLHTTCINQKPATVIIIGNQKNNMNFLRHTSFINRRGSIFHFNSPKKPLLSDFKLLMSTTSGNFAPKVVESGNL